MRFRVVAPQMIVMALGGVVALLLAGAPWGMALLGGVAAGVFAGAVALWAANPLIGRIESHASVVQDRAKGATALVTGEDALETADRTFAELNAQWTAKIARLSEESATLSAVLDGMAEGIWVTDKDGTIVRHNAALTRLLQPGQTITGQRPLSLVRSTELNDAVLAACRSGVTSSREVQVDASPPRVLNVQVIPLGRGLEGSAAVFHDVTELRRLEKVRKDFVANVSHELRTPITAIRGYSETLRAGALQDPEHAPKMVDVIHRQSERLSELVTDLLELSRLESGEWKPAKEPLSVAEVAARAAEGVRPRAEEKQLALTLDVPEDQTVLADPRALEQVLTNLLDNAVKYTPAGGRVSLSAERHGEAAWVWVQDTGIGIDPKHQARIFERFYRVDKGRSRETGGTGLGLSIVKHLVNAMGGEVQVSSQPGAGSRFTVVLPAAQKLDGGERGGMAQRG